MSSPDALPIYSRAATIVCFQCRSACLTLYAPTTHPPPGAALRPCQHCWPVRTLFPMAWVLSKHLNQGTQNFRNLEWVSTEWHRDELRWGLKSVTWTWTRISFGDLVQNNFNGVVGAETRWQWIEKRMGRLEIETHWPSSSYNLDGKEQWVSNS